MSSICATLRRRYLFLQMGLASLLTMARMWPWLEVFWYAATPQYFGGRLDRSFMNRWMDGKKHIDKSFWRDIIGIKGRWVVFFVDNIRWWDLLSRGHLPRDSGESCCGAWSLSRWRALHILGLRGCPPIRILLMVRAEMIILVSSYSKLRYRYVLLHSRWYNGDFVVSEVGVLFNLCGGCFQLHGIKPVLGCECIDAQILQMDELWIQLICPRENWSA